MYICDMENKGKGAEVQGTESARTENGSETKKKKVSTSFTVRQFKGNIEKMEATKMATAEELVTLKEIYKKVFERWMGLEMF